MNTNNVTRSLQSFIVLPFLAMNLIVGPAGLDIKLPTVAVSSAGEKRPLLSEEAANKQRDLEEKARKIDAYFAERNLPLAGYGMTFVIEAEKNSIDYRLVPTIMMLESTGGRNPCPNDEHNIAGWASCRVTFDSYEEAIAVVSRSLGGNDPKTAHYYKDKDIDGKLRSYNSVNPQYNALAKSVMNQIEKYEVS